MARKTELSTSKKAPQRAAHGPKLIRPSSTGQFLMRGKDGRVESTITYSNAPNPPSGPGFAEGASSAPSSVLADVVQRELDRASKGDRTDPAILDELLRHGFSREELFDLVIPRRTYARRRQANDPLSPEETDRAVRLARITALAERIFGDEAKAHSWLRKPSPMLEESTPLRLLKSETGAQLVEEALHRIDYGMFA